MPYVSLKHAAMFLPIFFICSCDMKSKKMSTDAVKPESEEQTAKKTLGPMTNGNTEVIKAFLNVFKQCQVSEWGSISGCKDKEAVIKQLEATERAVGIKATLMTYCYGLDAPDPLTQSFAGGRLQRSGAWSLLRKESSPEVFECLLNFLKKSKRPLLVRSAAKIAAYMAPILNKEDELLKVAQTTSEAIETVYYELWANGRLRVFPLLEKILKETKEVLHIEMAIRGFRNGPEFTDEEKTKVCPLLLSFSSNENIRIAGPAAYHVALACINDRPKLFAPISSHLKKNTLDATLVWALRAIGIASKPKKDRQVMALLLKALQTKKLQPHVRSEALIAIKLIDEKMALKEAKKFTKDSAPVLALTAQRIIEKKI